MRILGRAMQRILLAGMIAEEMSKQRQEGFVTGFKARVQGTLSGAPQTYGSHGEHKTLVNIMDKP